MSQKIGGSGALGGGSAVNAEVDAVGNLFTRNAGYNATGIALGGGPTNGPGLYTEADPGVITTARLMIAPEGDADYRLRISQELLLDDETFNYLAQNTGKHQYTNTTLTLAWTATGLQTNSGTITTINTGAKFTTYASFPVFGGGQQLYCQFWASANINPVTNMNTDVGLFLPGAATPYAPTDGVYFRLDSNRWNGVINYNGTETVVSLTGFTYAANQVYKFTITTAEGTTYFWINDVLYGSIALPVAQSTPFMSDTLPFSLRTAIGGTAASGALQLLVKDYTVSIGGTGFAEPLGARSNAIFGSYQGLSGGTMGGLTKYTNSTNPTAAVPSNTALTANLPSGLGGEAWETFTLAVNTDGILMSYQVPAGTVAVLGKRLKVTGVKMTAYVQTVLAGGPTVNTFAIAFGHTAVSLATAEAATTKKPRIVLCPELTNTCTAAQAVSTLLAQPSGSVSIFTEPIYVNPSEFIQFTVKHVGTVGTSGTIAYNIQFIYSWE